MNRALVQMLVIVEMIIGFRSVVASDLHQVVLLLTDQQTSLEHRASECSNLSTPASDRLEETTRASFMMDRSSVEAMPLEMGQGHDVSDWSFMEHAPESRDHLTQARFPGLDVMTVQHAYILVFLKVGHGSGSTTCLGLDPMSALMRDSVSFPSQLDKAADQPMESEAGWRMDQQFRRIVMKTGCARMQEKLKQVPDHSEFAQSRLRPGFLGALTVP